VTGSADAYIGELMQSRSGSPERMEGRRMELSDLCMILDLSFSKKQLSSESFSVN